ncbi:hypothetical protein [Paenibacillus kobensis]|uniref:hypothetical protein n=1 Tax=Paenibacillus kobensis TaxID=59841 RepID=UPI000FDBEE65|nr:hypothetical protein [Paenibacillus kobensis]
MSRAIAKYWITSVMVGLVIVFAFLYVRPGWETKGDPKLRLATLEGDPKAVANLSVWGTYRYSRDFNSRIGLDVDGIIHEKEPTLYEQTFEPWLSAKTVKNMFDGNLDFLRGKKNYGTFYSDDEMLAYANTEHVNDDWVLQISVLDKDTKQQSDFEVQYPDSNTRNYWFTDALQRAANGDIIVLSTHSVNVDAEETRHDKELVRLQIDTGKKAISSVTTVIAGREEDKKQLGLLRNTKVYNPMPYMLISAPMNGKWGYYSYQTATGKLSPISIVKAGTEIPTMFDVADDRLDYAYTDGSRIHLQSFDLATGQPESEEILIDTSQWNAVSARAVAANPKAFSIIYENKKADDPIAGVAIVDRKTGKVIYRAEVQADGTEQERQEALRKFDLVSGLAL